MTRLNSPGNDHSEPHVGCYFFSGLLTDISSGTKLSGGCGRARLPTSPVCREVTVREDVHPPGFKKFSDLSRQISDSGSGVGETAHFFRGAVVSWPPPEPSCHFQQVQCRPPGPSRFLPEGRWMEEAHERPRHAICVRKPTCFVLGALASRRRSSPEEMCRNPPAGRQRSQEQGRELDFCFRPSTLVARELTPVSRRSGPTMRPSSPIAANPNGMGIRRITPVTTHPKPSAVPNPFAVYPDVVRSGRDNDRFHRRGWRRFCHNHHACLRRGRTPGSCAD